MSLYTLHHVIGWALFAVMTGLIGSGLIYKYAKATALRIGAKKLHLKLAFGLIALLIVQFITVLF
jgi:hypothetical protein